MNNFIIFNTEKEGSCALVMTLDNFEKVNIISDYIEPFDRHMFIGKHGVSGKDIAKEDFLKCLSIIYDSSNNYLEELNLVYSQYNNQCKFKFSKDKSHGFKMRQRQQWKSGIFSILKKFDVTAFVLIRQDVFRWALSKYHGDGKGGKGHLQFEGVNIAELPKIEVSWRSLKKKIKKCERRIENQKRLLQDLQTFGVEAIPLYYEDFCNNKIDYFKQLLRRLDITITDSDIMQAIRKDCHYKKVHPDDISEFVENHEEISKKFEEYMLQKKVAHRYFSSIIPKILHRYFL
jgi:hypothetical protein